MTSPNLALNQLIPKRAAHDLSDVGLGEFTSEIDVARHFVSGERGAAMLDERFSSEGGIPLYDEECNDLASA